MEIKYQQLSMEEALKTYAEWLMKRSVHRKIRSGGGSERNNPERTECQ